MLNKVRKELSHLPCPLRYLIYTITAIVGVLMSIKLLDTAIYWVTALAGGLGVGAGASLVFRKVLRVHLEKKANDNQGYVESCRKIAAEFFYRYFDEHNDLVVNIEHLAGRGEYEQRIDHYYFDKNLPVFTLSLLDMSFGEMADKNRRRILVEQLQKYVQDFMSEGEFSLRSIQGIPEIIIPNCKYDSGEQAFKIRLIFCDKLSTYNSYLEYKVAAMKGKKK